MSISVDESFKTAGGSVVTALDFNMPDDYYKNVAGAIDSSGRLRYDPDFGFIVRLGQDIKIKSSSGAAESDKAIKAGTDFVIRGFLNKGGDDERANASGWFARSIGRPGDGGISAFGTVMDNKGFECDGCGTSTDVRNAALIVEALDGKDGVRPLIFGMDCVDKKFGLHDSRSQLKKAFGILDGSYFLADCYDLARDSAGRFYDVKPRANNIEGSIAKSSHVHAETFIGMKIAVDRLSGLFYATGNNPNDLHLIVPMGRDDEGNPRARIITRTKGEDNKIDVYVSDCDYSEAFDEADIFSLRGGYKPDRSDTMLTLAALSNAYYYDSAFRDVVDGTPLRLTDDIRATADLIIASARDDAGAGDNRVFVAAHEYWAKGGDEGFEQCMKNIVAPYYFEHTGIPFVMGAGKTYVKTPYLDDHPDFIEDQKNARGALFNALRRQDPSRNSNFDLDRLRKMASEDEMGSSHAHIYDDSTKRYKDVSLPDDQDGPVYIMAKEIKSGKPAILGCTLSPYDSDVFKGGLITAADLNKDLSALGYEAAEDTRIGICRFDGSDHDDGCVTRAEEYRLSSNFELGNDGFEECRTGISSGPIVRPAVFFETCGTVVRFFDADDATPDFSLPKIANSIFDTNARASVSLMSEVGDRVTKSMADAAFDLKKLDISKVVDIARLHEIFENAAEGTRISQSQFLKHPIEDNARSISGIECGRIDTLYVSADSENISIKKLEPEPGTRISIRDPAGKRGDDPAGYRGDKIDIVLRGVTLEDLEPYKKHTKRGQDVYALPLLDILHDRPEARADIEGTVIGGICGCKCGMAMPYTMSVSYNPNRTKWNTSIKYDIRSAQDSYFSPPSRHRHINRGRGDTGLLTLSELDAAIPNFRECDNAWFKDIQQRLSNATHTRFNAGNRDYERVRDDYDNREQFFSRYGHGRRERYEPNYYRILADYNKARADRILSYNGHEVARQLKDAYEHIHDNVVAANPSEHAADIAVLDWLHDEIPKNDTTDSLKAQLFSSKLQDAYGEACDGAYGETARAAAVKRHTLDLVDGLSGKLNLDPEVARSLRGQVEDMVDNDFDGIDDPDREMN